MSFDDFWQRDADFLSQADDCSYGPKAQHKSAQGRAQRPQPRSAALGYETIARHSPEGATLTRPIVVTPKPATQTLTDEGKSSSWCRKLNITGLFGGLLLAALLLAKGYYTEHATTRPIEDVRPAQRVIVDAPPEALATDIARLTDRQVNWNASDGSLEVEGIDDPLRTLGDATPEQITRADYRLILLRAYDVWADGTLDQINVETLQPWQWIQEHEAHVGADAPLPLDAVEMGLPEGMTGTVDDILPCPEFEAGRGRIVLTTVNHLNRDVLELTLEGESSPRETLRPTGTHKFYSVSSGQWLSASELQPGETLDGINGKVTVVASRKLPGTRRVYNFTVQGEHLYRVANCGVLVHNNCSNVVSEIGLGRVGGGKIDLNAPVGSGSSRIGTGVTAGGLSRTTSRWRQRYGPSSMREHHLVPQAMLNDSRFTKRLSDLGVTDAQRYIDRQISIIPHTQHAALHEAGWNRAWTRWLNDNPNFTHSDVQSQIRTMMQDFDVPRASRNYVRSYGRN